MKNLFPFLFKTSCIFLFFLCFFQASLNAQDKIHKTDNTIIEAKVIEISDTEIKYKVFLNQDGPINTISISDVHMVIYENGEKELYSPLKKLPVVVQPENTSPVNTQVSTTNSNITTNKTEKSQGLFFDLGFGFGLNAASQLLENNTIYDTTSFTNEVVVGSYGKGLAVKLGIGYQFNNNLGFIMNYSMLKGSKIKNSITNNAYSPPSLIEHSRSINMINLNPEFIFMAGNSSVKPYSRLGLLIGISPKLIHEYSEPSKSIERKSILTGGTPIGYSASLGIIMSHEKISFFGELGMINLSWAPKKAELIEYTENGEDKLSTLTTDQIETVFVESITSTSPSGTSGNKKLLKYYPLSSIGLNFGIRFSF